MDERTLHARNYFETLARLGQAMPLEPIARALAILERARAEGKRVFTAGNGGSASTAGHMANDLTQGAAKAGRPPLKAISLVDTTAIVTCVGNDEGYDRIFANPLSVWGERGDVLVAITGSGNSPNVLLALEEARRRGMTTIGLLGRGGGKAVGMVDVAVVVPSDDYGPIEDLHLALNHLFTAWLREHG